MGSWNSPGNPASRQLSILLTGPRRTGKSSTGNTLLGRGQVFDTRGGGASTAASAIIAGHHLTMVDAQGWGSSEEFVPKDEKMELLRALSLCGSAGPHIVLLVIPLLDFTEAERRAVEKRMEVFTSAVWRHTMVLFTFGDLLKKRRCSVQEHIQAGGPGLQWLMEMCRYRYHVFNNKGAITVRQGRVKQEVNEEGRRQGRIWQKRRDERGPGRIGKGGKADADREGEQQQEQVMELLRKVEDMLQENGEWHFSLHMYQRLQEEWQCREQQLRAGLEAETNVGKQNTSETKLKVEAEQMQRLETEELKQSLRTEPESVGRKIKQGGDKNKEAKVEFRRINSDEDRWDASSRSRKVKELERRVVMEENTDLHTRMISVSAS